jgi:hypothetical protein
MVGSPLSLELLLTYLPKELSQIHVVWRFLKTQASAVVEIHGKLSRESLKK